MTASRPLVLVAEDDPALTALLVEVLAEEGYDAVPSPDGLSALHYAIRHTPAAILLDGHLPRLDGFTFARIYAALPGPHAPVVLMSGDLSAYREIPPPHAVELLPKPFALDALIGLLNRLTHGSNAPGSTPVLSGFAA
jgi:two-component system, OmpR family, response regulator QseB